MIGFRTFTVILAISLAACASTPKGSTSYYFPKAETTLVITQTLSCDAKDAELHETVSVTPTTSYMSDLNVSPARFTPSNFDGTWADSDTALSFTDDGRLSGVNVTSVGQGATVIKDIVSVAGAVGAAAVVAPGGVYTPASACAIVKNYSAKPPVGGKPAVAATAPATSQQAPTVTLTYAATFDYVVASNPALNVTLLPVAVGASAVPSLPVGPDASSSSLRDALAKFIPKLEFDLTVTSVKPLDSAKWTGGGEIGDQSLTLNSVAQANISLVGPVGDLQGVGPVWQGAVFIPLTESKYLFKVPVPKATTFGTHKFVLALSSYGSIQKLEFSSSGTSDAADAASAVGGAVAKAFQSPTKTQQAADVQAQADLIYQQQRLITCKARPTDCPSK
jgi:hypothetical protein